MEKKYLLVSLEDEKMSYISEALSNKTSKKILNFLLDKKEASQKDISDSLKLPMNTVDYNVKKLLKSGLIEKAKNFFWSKKGKKIINYKISNTSIIISPNSSRVSSKIKSLIPVVILSGIATLIVKLITNPKIPEDNLLLQKGTEIAMASADSTINNSTLLTEPVSAGVWFAIGAIFVIIFFLLFNWRKVK